MRAHFGGFRRRGRAAVERAVLCCVALIVAAAALRAQTILPAQSVAVGGNLTLNAAPVAAATYQWQRNGQTIAGATGSALALTNVQPAAAGIYEVRVTAAGATTTSRIVVGVTGPGHVTGAATELGADIRHASGRFYDQVLLQGSAAAVTADPGQVTRTSFIDLNHDIVQVEFSGPGTLTLALDDATGPAAPVNYTQAVNYMRGHASIVITGATQETNVSVFTVGRATAFDLTGGFDILQPIGPTNQPANNGSPLFAGHGATAYDGVADIAFIAIASVDGKFGGVRTANANYFATRGLTGVYAPGVAFAGPVFVGDLQAQDNATPVLLLGSAADARVTGGDLLQANTQPVRVSGIAELVFAAGSTSHGTNLPQRANRARFETDGVDVTRRVFIDPAVAETRATLRANWRGDQAVGTGPVRLTHPPMALADIGEIVPLGLLAGGHVTPVDHIYFSPLDFSLPAGTYPVYAAASGTIVETSYRPGDNGRAGVYRLVVEHTATFYSYFDLVDVLSPQLAAQVPANVTTTIYHGRIPVTGGQLIGRVGNKTLDFSVVDLERPLAGFITPAHYLREPWKIFTVDTFEAYDEPLRSQLLAKNRRVVAPRGGRIDFDVAGRLSGNWFKVGTNFYAGDDNPHGYWSGHLAVVPYVLNPAHIVVSLGSFNGEARQFGVRGNAPDPAGVSPATGMVKYELIPPANGPGDPFLGGEPQVFGTVLFQVLADERLKVQIFPGQAAATVTGFTSAAETYER